MIQKQNTGSETFELGGVSGNTENEKRVVSIFQPAVRRSSETLSLVAHDVTNGGDTDTQVTLIVCIDTELC